MGPDQGSLAEHLLVEAFSLTFCTYTCNVVVQQSLRTVI